MELMQLDQEANDFITFAKGKNFKILESEVDYTEEMFLKLLKKYPDYKIISFYYNEFRIANSSIVKRKRPQVLMSGVFEGQFPNRHSLPLLEFADVMALSCGSVQYPFYSTINTNPSNPFFYILKNLPEGFVPDFYFDNQVEKGHYIPSGLEIAPFPLIASVCHTFLHKSIEHVCHLFDKVLPVSTFEANLLRKKFPNKILDIPFGLNWGSFDHFITPCYDKTVDVALTFGPTNAPSYQGTRNQIVEKIKEFKTKYGTRFNVLIIEESLPYEQYIDLIKKSLIVINSTGVHGPYNYRTVETMCASSLLFQYDWNDPFFKNNFEGLFKDGVHGVSFTLDNLEHQLLYFLEHKDEALKIAKEGCSFVQTFSYLNLYKTLYEEVKKIDLAWPRSFPNSIGYHHVDMIYFNQANTTLDTLMTFGPLFDFCTTPWIKFNNFMVQSVVHTEISLSDVFLLALSIEPIMKAEAYDKQELCHAFYERALAESPEEFKWIIEWNYLMIGYELKFATKESVAKVLELLQNTSPIPFEEDKVIFKYYNSDYFDLNIELMKNIDSPEKRAGAYLHYAQSCCIKLPNETFETSY